MLFLLFELDRNNPGGHTLASVWVDSDEPQQAEHIARARLSESGYRLLALTEVTASTRDDYFPPCPGLDAFQRAEREGFAINYA